MTTLAALGGVCEVANTCLRILLVARSARDCTVGSGERKDVFVRGMIKRSRHETSRIVARGTAQTSCFKLSSVRILMACLALVRGADEPAHLSSGIRLVAALAIDLFVSSKEWKHIFVPLNAKILRLELLEPVAVHANHALPCELAVMGVLVTTVARILPAGSSRLAGILESLLVSSTLLVTLHAVNPGVGWRKHESGAGVNLGSDAASPGAPGFWRAPVALNAVRGKRCAVRRIVTLDTSGSANVGERKP